MEHFGQSSLGPWVFLVLLPVSTLCSGRSETSYRPIKALDNRIGQDVFSLGNMTVESKTDCAILCEGKTRCSSFTYDGPNRRCYLHAYVEPTPGDIQEGAVTFSSYCVDKCPQHFISLDCALCLRLSEEPCDVETARNRCSLLGARLLALQTPEKGAMVSALIKQKVGSWFGWVDALFHTSPENRWVWETTGETIEFWMGSAPNAASNENCLKIEIPRMHVIEELCRLNYRYICEYNV